ALELDSRRASGDTGYSAVGKFSTLLPCESKKCAGVAGAQLVNKVACPSAGVIQADLVGRAGLIHVGAGGKAPGSRLAEGFLVDVAGEEKVFRCNLPIARAAYFIVGAWCALATGNGRERYA